ncbi:MAG: TIR domain-containing protein [Halobacteriota archaeon]
MEPDIAGVLSQFKSIKKHANQLYQGIEKATSPDTSSEEVESLVEDFKNAKILFDMIKYKQRIDTYLRTVKIPGKRIYKLESYEQKALLRKIDIECETAIGILESIAAPLPKDSNVLRGNKVFFAFAIKREELVLNLARHVEKEHGVSTVLMNEESHGGRSLVEKFEELANECGFGIFVLTGDDESVTPASGGEKWVKRPRQNVILEFGYFWGKLGRKKRIAVLVEEDLEIPADLQGLGCIPITSDLGKTKLKLSQELRSSGLL